MLEIDVTMLFITIITFILLIGLLNKLFYAPMLGYMQRRDDEIKKDLDASNSNNSEVSALYEKAEEIIANAKSEAKLLKAKALKEAQELANSKVENQKAEIATRYAEFEANLAKDKEALRGALLAQAPQYKDALNAKLNQL
jgi:F-type H+-transporting ATPase subunit b